MSLIVDKQFLNLLSARLDRFKWKSGTLANCRCPFCGDSQKNKYKARGYFYTVKGKISFKCHNCEKATSLGGVIKHFDGQMFKQYIMERFSTGEKMSKKKEAVLPEYKGEAPVFQKKELIDNMMDRVDRLPDDHMAVQLCKHRMIPGHQWKRLYHIDDVKALEQLSESYRDRITSNEPRLVLPFWTNTGKLFALTCRSYEPDAKLRYLMLKLDENIPLIYGSEIIDPKRHIYVVEGPIDSLFIDNCIAVAGSDFKKVRKILGTENSTLIFDNQPRNRDVLRQMREAANAGYSLFIWPDTVRSKDINDWFLLTGASKDAIMDIINENTFSGPAAVVNIENWNRT
jgi:hypothetical protein